MNSFLIVHGQNKLANGRLLDSHTMEGSRKKSFGPRTVSVQIYACMYTLGEAYVQRGTSAYIP
jgi:hypothetical protein